METDFDYYNKLKNNLENLKLHGFSTHLDEVLSALEKESVSVVEGLYRLSNYELRIKEERAYQGCVKQAGFPFIKTMDDFDFTFQPSISKQEMNGLRSLRFIENKENILFLGSPGTGKTHLAVSLGIEAARNRISTYFINCSDLLAQLEKARQENRLEQRMKFINRYKLLIIDEVGFLSMSPEASKIFFQLISKRYEHKSTIITTNKELSQWGEMFQDPVLANAILDRFLHHCSVIKIVGPSYRTREFMTDTE